MPSSRLLAVIAAAFFAMVSTYYTWIAAIKATTLTEGECRVAMHSALGNCSGGKKQAPAPLLASASVSAFAMTQPRVGTMVLGTEYHSDNCVFFVRDRVPTLPFGLATWKGKLAIINAQQARPGDVAVIQVASGAYKDVGHVALVEEVTDSSITILEANFYAGRVSRRTASGADLTEAARALGIAGYFRP